MPLRHPPTLFTQAEAHEADPMTLSGLSTNYDGSMFMSLSPSLVIVPGEKIRQDG
jgi:hypothetical protein